jgi:alpha/beta superfamily hydrolase
VTARPGYTVGLPAPEELGLEMPILVVTGENDEQIHPDDQREWAEAAGARAVLIKGANHFFWARYEALAKAVGDFLAEVVSG